MAPAQEAAMPATSKAQQRAAGAALSAKRGETKVRELKGASKDMYKSMTEKELEELASADHDGLPDHKPED
jgi:hypothetical protein